MEKTNIFRKSSLDRISSPEQLNEYIRVSKPSVWLILISIIILLIGVCVWGAFGTLTTTQKAVTIVKNNIATSYVNIDQIKSIDPGMPVQLGDISGTVLSVDSVPIKIDENFEGTDLGEFSIGDIVFPVEIDLPANNGVHIVEIITEVISPFAFVLN